MHDDLPEGLPGDPGGASGQAPAPFATRAWDPQAAGADCAHCSLGPNSPFTRVLTASQPDGKGGKKTVQVPRLVEWSPVPPEINRGAGALSIGEAPGGEEEREGRPMIGRAGNELMRALDQLGVTREMLSLDNVASCRPPQNELDLHVFKVEKHNRAERKRADRDPGYTPQTYLLPTEACRPRMLAVARRYENLLLLGGTALRAFLGPKASIMDMRGGPLRLGLDVDGSTVHRDKGEGFPAGKTIAHVWKALPALHPAHVLRAKRWRRVFHTDLGRALRLWSGRLAYSPPVKLLRPTPQQVEAFLCSGLPVYVFDAEWGPGRDEPSPSLLPIAAREADAVEETAAPDPGRRRRGGTRTRPKRALLDPLRARMRCLGVGNRQVVMVIPFLSIDGVTTFYTYEDLNQIRGSLRRFFRDPRILKAGWNSSYADRMLIERSDEDAGGIGALPWPNRDGITDHGLVASELPHRLAFTASLYSDAPSYKEDHTATEARSDLELHSYCAMDVATTDIVISTLAPMVQKRNQEHLVMHNARRQSACVGLHRAGLFVDQGVRIELERGFEAARHKWLEKAAEYAGRRVTLNADGTVAAGFNANSQQQVADVLYNDWDLPIYDFTDSGEPSTDDDVIIKLFTDPVVDPPKRRFLGAVRKVRKTVKKLGTYVYRCRPQRMGGHVWPDGRLRTGWNAHTTTSGRYSSSEPFNFQNVAIPLRIMFRAAPGHVYVGADFDQLELRVVTARTQAKNYLRIFREGGDPHSYLAEMVWGDLFRNASGDKKSGTKGRMRDLSKRVQYASLFSAGIETIHEQIVQAENEDEELIYADFSMQETQAVYYKWLEIAPEFPVWWKEEVELWRKRGFVESLILHRRRDCLDSTAVAPGETRKEDEEEDRAQLVNHSIQSTGREIVELAQLKLLEEFPFDYAGPGTGLVHDGHDSMLFEVPEDQAEYVAKRTVDVMTSSYPELPGVTFTAEASIGVRWTDRLCKRCKGHVDKEMARWRTKEIAVGKATMCENEGRCR